MRFIILILLFSAYLNADFLDDLLQKAKMSTKAQEQMQKQRQEQFLNEYKKNKNALEKLKQELKLTQEISKKLEQSIDKNAQEISTKEERLKNLSGDLKDISLVAKQNIAEFTQTKLEYFSGVYNPKSTYNTSDNLISLTDMQNLWLDILKEINFSSKVFVSSQEIITNSGKKTANVLQVGNFVAFGDVFLKQSKNKLVQTNQPSSKYKSIMQDFIKSKNAQELVVIDPSRGAILELISRKPTLKDRLKDGGIIGAIIIGIGLVGLIFAFIKIIFLFKKPLVLNELKKEAKTLEDVLDLAYQRQESGMGMLGVFIAAAPLLGLLGTVTGMILTFGSITLFGTSDPKLMAGGISQALITTMLGLSVAIILLFFKSILERLIDKNAQKIYTKAIKENA